MSGHTDAVGYLLDLRDALQKPWFDKVVDLAIASNGTPISQAELDELWRLFKDDKAVYTPAAVPPISMTSSGSPSQSFLRLLADFSDYKKLSPDLRLQLTKQITVIFGRNGAGKSSLCQALKILASPEKPAEPLGNVRANAVGAPSFSYKFTADASTQRWDETKGFGSRSAELKFFDSMVALRHVSADYRAESAVEVSAFRLEVFDFAGGILEQFIEFANTQVKNAEDEVDSDGHQIQSDLELARVQDIGPFHSPEEIAPETINFWLASIDPIDSATNGICDKLSKELKDLEEVASPEGLANLKLKLEVVSGIKRSLGEFLSTIDGAQLSSSPDLERSINAKAEALKELGRRVFPIGADPDKHGTLVIAASKCVDLSHAELKECPLCRSSLSANSTEIFNAYRQYLESDLSDEISALTDELQTRLRSLPSLRAYSLGADSCEGCFAEGFVDKLERFIQDLQRSLPLTDASFLPAQEQAADIVPKLRDGLGEVERVCKELNDAIEIGTHRRDEIEGKISSIKIELRRKQDAIAIDGMRSDITSYVTKMIATSNITDMVGLVNFGSILRQLTNKGKSAHEALVIENFERILDQEYVALCGAHMSDVGVTLATRGNRQEITVRSKVGGSDVNRVLSEGEQKVHALAMFMCEAEASSHQVLVLDDPVTCFDYNYVSNFCTRLRDFAVSHPDTQLIVFTHNWDFFMNIQAVMNRSSALQGRTQIQVLEDCARIKEHTDAWNTLEPAVRAVVDGSSEPTPKEKEDLAGDMRRLIEILTNEFVFNGQRHQYKNKTLEISVFDKFSKIVPLLSKEASDLRDLYGNLSPAEHDDVRNFYGTKSRLQYKTWFDTICSIKIAVQARRPT